MPSMSCAAATLTGVPWLSWLSRSTQPAVWPNVMFSISAAPHAEYDRQARPSIPETLAWPKGPLILPLAGLSQASAPCPAAVAPPTQQTGPDGHDTELA